MKRLLILLALIAFALVACGNPSTNRTGLEEGGLAVNLSATGISKAAPFMVTLDADVTGTSSSLSYTWDYGEFSDVNTNGRATRTYHHPGTYNVSVTVSDGKTTASDTITIRVLEPRYYGDWAWVAMYPDESYYSGVLSITLKVPDEDGFTNTSGGSWGLESATGIEGPYGVGILGMFTDAGATRLSLALLDASADPVLAAFDNDNRIGNEVEGMPSFIGTGLWYDTYGSTDAVAVGVSHFSGSPTYRPNPNSDPTYARSALQAASVASNANASLQAAPANVELLVERLNDVIENHRQAQ